MFDTKTLSEYGYLKDTAGVVDLEGCLVRLTGADRHQFLHNFCTNEIKALPAMRVCEAFILDGKGKILFHVYVLNADKELWLFSVADDGDAIIEHLDKYLLRDDVQMTSVTDRRLNFIMGGQSPNLIGELSPATPDQNELVELSSDTLIAHVELAGWGYLVLTTDEDFLPATLAHGGLDAFHALRIENQTPWMGVDINNTNLPQELLRDEKCISFTKGCYLGQETVARIDAIGRVNRVIALVKSEHKIESGTELVLAEKTIGKLLSVSWSPDQACFLALAMVRRPHEKSGAELPCGSTFVTVV